MEGDEMTNQNRVFNFSAGPSMLPLNVIEDAAANLADYEGCGQSVMEMSHRSKEFGKIIEDAEANLREIMNIPDNYKVMFLQGGGTLQFAMVPLNLLRASKKADYVVTGSWRRRHTRSQPNSGDIKVIASSEENTFTYIPEITKKVSDRLQIMSMYATTIRFMAHTIHIFLTLEIFLWLPICQAVYSVKKST